MISTILIKLENLHLPPGCTRRSTQLYTVHQADKRSKLLQTGAALERLSAEIKPAWRFSRGLKGPQDFVIESVALTENVKLLEGQSLKALVYNGKSWAKM